jgi:hypothetical protein
VSADILDEELTAAHDRLLAAATGDLELAIAESARTGRAALVEYRPGGSVIGVRHLVADSPTSVHGHGSWGAALVLSGRVRYERFAGVADHVPLETCELSSGGTTSWTEPPGDVHRQVAEGADAIELVLLGRDPQTVGDRAARYIGSLAYDSLSKLYAPNVLFDADVPQWRFQLQGRDSVLETLRQEELALPNVRVRSCSWSETVDGGVVVRRESACDGEGGTHIWRDVHVLRVEGGWITRHNVACTGVWDPATIARQHLEAPMVEP